MNPMDCGAVIQGFFPGGQPHSSVLFRGKKDYSSSAESTQTIQTLLRHPNNFIIRQKLACFNRENYTLQCHFPNNNSKAYPIDISRLNLTDNGFPIKENVLRSYENLFDAKLSDVKIHEGGGEAEAIGALAFTSGKDIYFAAGRYNPFTQEGQRLLGHELTHVIQQKEGRVKNTDGNCAAFVYDPGLEAEAERVGIKIANNLNAYISKSNTNSLIQLSSLEETENRFHNKEKNKLMSSEIITRYGGIINLIKLGKIDDVSQPISQSTPQMLKEMERHWKAIDGLTNTDCKLWELPLTTSGMAYMDPEVLDEFDNFRNNRNLDKVVSKIFNRYEAKFKDDIKIFKIIRDHYSPSPNYQEVVARLAKIKKEWADVEIARPDAKQKAPFFAKRITSKVKIDWLNEHPELLKN